MIGQYWQSIVCDRQLEQEIRAIWTSTTWISEAEMHGAYEIWCVSFFQILFYVYSNMFVSTTKYSPCAKWLIMHFNVSKYHTKKKHIPKFTCRPINTIWCIYLICKNLIFLNILLAAWASAFNFSLKNKMDITKQLYLHKHQISNLNNPCLIKAISQNTYKDIALTFRLSLLICCVLCCRWSSW